MSDINKFDKETLKSYWDFVDKLHYDCENQNAYVVKMDIMKRLSPMIAEKYKDITDALAFSLYREVYSDKKNSYLYACYDAISRGSKFYESCWLEPSLIAPLEARLNPDIISEQNFSNVFPFEDDFYNEVEEPLIDSDFSDSIVCEKTKLKNGKVWKDEDSYYEE